MSYCKRGVGGWVGGGRRDVPEEKVGSEAEDLDGRMLPCRGVVVKRAELGAWGGWVGG